jgi:16S rRNA (guanine966-N2)-methyltransferase
MTRIIGGSARGRRLAVPPIATRPTSDRAREGLFSSLDARVDLDGARVLDLFAGSGAVGLEALSRGAAAVRLVESHSAVAQTITANAAAVGLPGAEVITAQVERHLLGPLPPAPFDVVFADPPYAMSQADVTALLLALSEPGWLSPGAMVVLERSSRGPEGHDGPDWPGFVTPVQSRRYGEGTLWYGRWP